MRIINATIESPLLAIPALIGLAAIVVTGALGAAIVYGPDIDPFVKIIYSLTGQR